jgi:hypothetical protein
MLEKAAKDAGKLEPRKVRAAKPFPDRGVGVNKEGGVRLAVSVIGLRNGQQEGPPAVDSILLTREQWARFAPAGEMKEWTFPEATARTFAPALSPITDSILVPRPADLSKASVTAQVERKAGDRTVIRYTGAWESKHFRDGDSKFPILTAATGEGIGVTDADGKKLESLIWVLTGTVQVGPKGTPVRTAAVVEWQAEEE